MNNESNSSPEVEQKSPVILFDFGGVIVKNGFWDWVATVTDVEQEKGTYGQVIDAADAGSITEEECLQQLSNLAHKSPDIVKQELFSSFTLNEDVVDVIKELKEQGYPMVLVTNFMKSMVNTLIDKYELRPYFSKLLISSEIGLIKPSPEFFRFVTADLGISPAGTIFIDDSQRNIDTAVGEGIERAWLFTKAEQLRQKFEESNILTSK